MTPSIDSSMVCTTDELPGYRIIQSLGVAEGFAITFYAGFTLSGQKEALIGTLRDAIIDMLATAAAQGANAIVGLRYNQPSSQGERVAMAYGTAVKVEKNA
jgi:uncharacterized protein YbjQ (UPF0145 family)